MWWIKFRNHSIKRQIASSLIMGAILLWLLILIGSYYTIRHEVDELYDGELSQLARVLLTLYASDDVEARARKNGALVTSPPFEGSDNYENKLLFQVWGNNKTLLVRSSNAPETPIAKKLAQAELNQYDTVEIFGNKTRIFTLWIPQVPFVIHVGQKIDLRSEIAFEILESFYLLFLLILPVLLFIIFRSINKGLTPLNQIAGQITERSSDNLDPVDLANVPDEIKGLAGSLNNLFNRLKNSFTRERQFIADAAHELRTPLAGLKAQAQIALQDESRVKKSLTRIVEGVDRTSRLANQLLSLSRLEAEEIKIRHQDIVLNNVIDDVCHDLQSMVEEKKISIQKSINSNVTVNGDRDMLYMLVRNLLENAIRYSDENTKIDIILDKLNSQHRLQIIDNGPGIPAKSLTRIFDRFYRDIDVKESGSGLGLAIAKRITDLHDVKLSLTNRTDTNGLCATVIF